MRRQTPEHRAAISRAVARSTGRPCSARDAAMETLATGRIVRTAEIAEAAGCGIGRAARVLRELEAAGLARRAGHGYWKAPPQTPKGTLMVRPARKLPAEVFHPSEFIEDELAARGWTLDVLAERMASGGLDGPEVNLLSLRIYRDVGPKEPKIRLGGRTAAALGRALGVEAAFLLELEARWLAAQDRKEG